MLGGCTSEAPAGVLEMFNPSTPAFLPREPLPAFIAMGSVVLAVTGPRRFTRHGPFRARPIKFSWLYFVMPALLLNYMGQGACCLRDPRRGARNGQESLLLPCARSLRLPLVILATWPTIIASQAVISGAFSVTQQAIQLGFIPRLRITHTSEHAAGRSTSRSSTGR
jgi:KUP system potassium uptake protein